MTYEYYDILGISRDADADTIKKAYRKKAMESHPDRHAGDKNKEAEFKKINEAYGVLSDDQKKAYYDRYGTMEQMGGGYSGFQGGFEGDISDIFSSFFGGGFGGGRGRSREQVGDDIEIRVKISLEDAIRGTKRKIEYEREILCDSCHGKGGETKKCGHCQGTGQVTERVRTIFGMVEQAHLCPQCDGTGEEITKKCGSCHGKKTKRESIKKEIDVPAGIEHGMSIKMRSEGHAARDGSGDLFLTFEVPSKEGGLVREWANLHYEVKLSPAEAVLWGTKTLDIPILGKRELTIEAGTSHGETKIYRGEWLPRLDRRGMEWDLIIHYIIQIPTKISKEERELYESLRDLQKNQGEKKWFFEGLFQ